MSPRLWKPVSEADIVEGIKNGSIAESHFIEVKEQARNEQIAQTIASFAIDGGMFILGIAEEKGENGAKRLVHKPLPVEGLPERIDGITRNNIEPPLPVTTTIISSGTDGEGYVVITVEASPLAPHMTGNKYYGRGGASKHALCDAEVLRHHERRRRQDGLGMQILDDAESNDYLPKGERQYGHVYLIAEPLMAVNESRVEEFLDNDQELTRFIQSGQNECRANLASFYPTPEYATRVRRRDTGVSMVNSDADGPGRTPNSELFSEKSLLDIELRETGGLRIFIGRGTDFLNPEEKIICDGIAVAYTQRLLFWTNKLSELYGYHSLWSLGLRINGIQGLRSQLKVDNWDTFESPSTMDTDVYSRVHNAGSNSIATEPDTAIVALVGRLLKVLGTTKNHLQ